MSEYFYSLSIINLIQIVYVYTYFDQRLECAAPKCETDTLDRNRMTEYN